MTKLRELRLVDSQSSSSKKRPQTAPTRPSDEGEHLSHEEIIRRHIDALQILALERPKALKVILRLTEKVAYPNHHRKVSHGR